MVPAADILKANVLIVDDQEANVRLLERTLKNAGYTCVTSTLDPLEVCSLHRTHNYDLILFLYKDTEGIRDGRPFFPHALREFLLGELEFLHPIVCIGDGLADGERRGDAERARCAVEPCGITGIDMIERRLCDRGVT